MSQEYFESVAQDLGELGFRVSTPLTQTIANYHALHGHLMLPTKDFEPSKPHDKSYQPLTEAGRVALLGIQNSDPDDIVARRLICCGTAEPKLLKSLDQQHVQNPDKLSSVIITVDNRPVAIVKGSGEAAAYGLEDLPEFGIIRGVFSAPPPPLEQAMKHIKAANKVELEEVGAMTLLRITSFTMPPDELTGISSEAWHGQVTTTRHQDIVDRTSELLQDAEPLHKPKRRFLTNLRKS